MTPIGTPNLYRRYTLQHILKYGYTRLINLELIILGLIISISTINVPLAYAQSSDWTLTVNAVNVPFGDSNIHFSIKGPFGYTNFDNIPNSQYPSTSFNMPGNQFPTGYRYQVCVSSSALGWLLPNCVYYRHGEGNEIVSISPY